MHDQKGCGAFQLNTVWLCVLNSVRVATVDSNIIFGLFGVRYTVELLKGRRSPRKIRRCYTYNPTVALRRSLRKK